MTTNQTLASTAMRRIAELENQLGEARAKVASLENELAPHRKRAQAEQILVRAYHSPDTSPKHLISKTVDDFLDKRAHLEEKAPIELNKIAELSNYAVTGEVRFGLTGDGSDKDGDADSDLYRHIDNYRQSRNRR